MTSIWRALLLLVVSCSAFGQAPPTPNPSALWAWCGVGSCGTAASASAAITAMCTTWTTPSAPTVAVVGTCITCTSGICGGANYNLGGQYCSAHCELGATDGGLLGNFYQQPQCPTSWNLNVAGTGCESPLCAANVGKEVDFEVTWLGAEADANPAYGCYAGCKANFQSGSRFDVTVGTGDRYNAYKGIAILSSAACSGADKNGGLLSAFRAVVAASTGLAGSGTGVGGVGSDRGIVSAFGQTDGLNLAKIATNTARIADAIAGGTGGTGGTGTGTGGSTCGGPSQPACATEIDVTQAGLEGSGALPAVAAGIGTIDSAKATNEAQLAAAAGSLTESSAPTFGGSGSWWQPTLAPFVGVASVCTYTWTPTFPHIGAMNFTLNLCGHAHYLQSFLYWAFGLWTMWSLWSTAYAPRKEQ